MKPFIILAGSYQIQGMDFNTDDVFEISVADPTMLAHPNANMLTSGNITVSILGATKTFGTGEVSLFRPFSDGTLQPPAPAGLTVSIKANEPTRYLCVSPTSGLTFTTYETPITLTNGTLVVPLEAYSINEVNYAAGTPFAVEDSTSVLTTLIGGKIGVFTPR